MNINIINDIFLTAQESIIETYGRPLNDENYKEMKDKILNDLFSKEEIEEYNQFLKAEGHSDFINLTKKV